MKHCDTLITLTENLGRGWEGEWLVQSSHFPCPVFPAPAPFLASSLKPLCKAAIIKMIVTLFSSISPASHPFIIITSRPFLSLPLNLQATYSPGLPPPCARLQDLISDDICSIFWKLDQTLPTLSFIASFTMCQTKNRVQFWFFRSLTFTFDSKIFAISNCISRFGWKVSLFQVWLVLSQFCLCKLVYSLVDWPRNTCGPLDASMCETYLVKHVLKMSVFF